MEAILNIINIIVGFIPAATMLIGGAALIATKTPNKSDDRIIQVILDIINFIGANFGKAKNTD